VSPRARAIPGQFELDVDLTGLDVPGSELAAPQVVSRTEAPRVEISARRIAALLERPLPTAEQVAVIEAPVEPLLVVAGAGSGKTETMAARVVWLVANGYVGPERVLGLTFTRKAAGELADRVRARLRALHRTGLTATAPEPVAISTYHSYAASIVADHALRLGLDPGARVLGEAGAWQLVDELVAAWDGDMTEVSSARATVVDAVLALAGECAEHLVGPGDVDAALADVLDRLLELPALAGEQLPGRPSSAVKTVIGKLAARRRLVDLVAAYLERKRELGVVDFGDQVALAARIAREVPEVGAGERERYGVVLLDEYQDTSHAQLSLLRELFGQGHPVTAVGDPHQSIYGWRGASAGNLQRFPLDFPPAAGHPAAAAQLSTSWRNDHAVLAVANRVAADLRRPAPWASPDRHVDVPALQARPDAGVGQVTTGWFDTLEGEAAAVATMAEQAFGEGGSVAVLCRTRSQFPLVEAELRLRGLPVEVVGLGGLLHVPEVVDLRAALEVIHDPSRGDSLMRLLTGAAWRVGPRDLDALGAWARALARRASHAAGRDVEPDSGSEGGRGRGREVGPGEGLDEVCLVEALDTVPPPGWVAPGGQQLSAEGRQRLVRLSGVLRHLRGRTGLALPDLVLEVERALLLDIEVAARPGVGQAVARAHLDAFVDVAAGFEAGLGAFLAWLTAAENEERGLEAGVVEHRDDAVQIVTVHAAKGLEWDAVAVTGLVEGTFPTGHAGRAPQLSYGWLTALGAVPFPIRGDAAGLPHWRVESVESQAQLTEELGVFRQQCGDHEVAEERRLAYVAFTRARHRLLLTGATWADGSTPRVPSRFLLEVAEVAGRGDTASADGAVGDGAGRAGVGPWAEPPPEGAVNPRESLTRSLLWPYDPLGRRRDAVERAGDLVRAAQAELAALPDDLDDGLDDDQVARDWAHEVDLLLAERDASAGRSRQVQLPSHLSASQLVALAADPQALAQRLRRPLPEPPSPASRRGSAFHAWLEQRFGAAALVDVDELPGAADSGDDDADLQQLQATFLASPWAERVPDQVEVNVETSVAGLLVRGRIDAVFRGQAAGSDRDWVVVDWKTGAAPTGARQQQARAVQLAVYRLAWARLVGVAVEQVSAAFFYAATGETVTAADLLDEAGLADLVRGR
jgi:DNA helicase II / ATP-dependent DNA helicase PcrA